MEIDQVSGRRLRPIQPWGLHEGWSGTNFCKGGWPTNAQGGRILRKSYQEFGRKGCRLQVAIPVASGCLEVDLG